jgi:hypothetical protein
MNFDYKKYSLENLENWMYDALSSSEATPQEIYDVIKGVVEEQYNHFTINANHCNELLSLLNGDKTLNVNTCDIFACDKDDSSPECKKSWSDFWGEHTGSTVSSVQSTEEKEKIREYNLREAEYYDKRAKLDGEHSKYYYDYDRNDPSRLNPFKEDKVKKWLLPVQQSVIDGVDDYYVNFPDDLLEAANLKEGDQVEWVDNNNGSYTLRKVTKPLGMDEC